MTYTDSQFGHDLLAQLDAGYDPIRIAKWAFTVWRMDPNRRRRSAAVEQCLGDLAVMEEGPEFYMSEVEIRAMANRFISPE
jgi:hypothetical protein